MADINIKDLLWAVREELEQSEKKRVAEGKEPLFRIDTLELELNFVVADSAETEGGFDFKIVKLGGKAGARTEDVQKIKLSLKAAENKAGEVTFAPMQVGGVGSGAFSPRLPGRHPVMMPMMWVGGAGPGKR